MVGKRGKLPKWQIGEKTENTKKTAIVGGKL